MDKILRLILSVVVWIVGAAVCCFVFYKMGSIGDPMLRNFMRAGPVVCMAWLMFRITKK